MAKLILDNVTNLQNESSAVTTINNNSDLIEAAIENTLSRDGTSPNEMNANLDMNSNRILNLPLPSADTEPVRKGEFDSVFGDLEALELVLEAELTDHANDLVTNTLDPIVDQAEAAQLAAENAQAAAEQAQTDAETAETNAENSAIAAAQSAAEAAISADNFDDVYLGSKPSDPTLDNDGDPLVEGQLYFNNTSDSLKIYDGATWLNYTAATGLTSVADDTSPSLGGNLDLNSNDITGTGNIDITGTIEQSGNAVLDASDIGVTVQGYDATILVDADIGSTVQAYDADLTTWAGVTPGTGVTTALGINVGSSGAVVVHGGALGTPSSGTLTNATGLPAAGVVNTALTVAGEDQGPLTGGASVTKKSLGSGTGTITVDVSDRPCQTIANDTGAFSLVVGTSHEGSTVVIIINGASAGAITTSDFNVVKGDSFDTTNGSKFRCIVEYWGSGNKWLFVEKMA